MSLNVHHTEVLFWELTKPITQKSGQQNATHPGGRQPIRGTSMRGLLCSRTVELQSVNEIKKRGVNMATKTMQWCRDLFLGLAALVLMAGCASSPQAVDTDLPATGTPEPSGLHCIHQSGRNDLCYAEDSLAEDAALLENAIRTFCLQNDRYWCYFYVWRDEESVADSVPLTAAETSSLFARFTSNPHAGLECFQVFEDGEVVHSTGNCE